MQVVGPRGEVLAWGWLLSAFCTAASSVWLLNTFQPTAPEIQDTRARPGVSVEAPVARYHTMEAIRALLNHLSAPETFQDFEKVGSPKPCQERGCSKASQACTEEGKGQDHTFLSRARTSRGSDKATSTVPPP